MTAQPSVTIQLPKRMLQGAGAALILLLLLFATAGDPNPEYQNGSLRWMILPLTLVPFSGAVSGIFIYFIEQFCLRNGWNRWVGFIVSTIIFVILFTVAFVLGMNGPN